MTHFSQRANIAVCKGLQANKNVFPEKPTPVYETDDKGNVLSTMAEHEKLIYSKELSHWMTQMDECSKQYAQFYHLLKGQCHPNVTARLKELPYYQTMKENMDVVQLRSALRNMSLATPKSKEPFVGMLNAITTHMSIKQGPDESVTSYYGRYQAAKDMVDQTIGGDNGNSNDAGFLAGACDDAILNIICTENGYDASNLSSEERAAYIKEGTNRLIGAHFFLGADQGRYKDLTEDYARNYLSDINKYPESLAKAYVTSQRKCSWTTGVSSTVLS